MPDPNAPQRYLRQINIFISSPADVRKERKIVNEVVTRLNRLPSIADRFVLNPLAYEELVPPMVGESAQEIVDRYMEAGRSDIFICLLWHRFGTPFVYSVTGEQFQSGTEYEFISAYKSYEDKKTPQMLLYRCKRAVPQSADPTQWGRVQNFFGQFYGANAKYKGLIADYKSHKEFENMLLEHLARVIDGLAAPPPTPAPSSTPAASGAPVTISTEPTPAVAIDPLLKGCSQVRLSIMQFFRMADVLTQPGAVKYKLLYRCLTEPSIYRRVLNGDRRLTLGDLGELKPVAINDPYDRFWRVAIPSRLNQPNANTITFFPFHRSLTEELRQMAFSVESFDDPDLQARLSRIHNWQISGHLRIYPPGVGVVRMNVSLGFRGDADAEVLSLLARDFADLLFVDPAGQTLPAQSLFVDEIDRVSNAIFGGSGLEFNERRWQPAFCAYALHNDEGFDISASSAQIAAMLAFSPENDLAPLVLAELSSRRWQNEGTFTMVNQGAACLYVDDLHFGNRKRAKVREDWLHETTELGLAAIYAYSTILDELAEATAPGVLTDDWLPGAPNHDYLTRLLQTTGQVLRAIQPVEKMLEKQGTGPLVDYCRKLWAKAQKTYSREQVKQLTDVVGAWVDAEVQPHHPAEAAALTKLLAEIARIEVPF